MSLLSDPVIINSFLPLTLCLLCSSLSRLFKRNLRSLLLYSLFHIIWPLKAIFSPLSTDLCTSTNVDVLVLLSLYFKHFKFSIAISSLIHGLFINMLNCQIFGGWREASVFSFKMFLVVSVVYNF